jgi:hypothetical protein
MILELLIPHYTLGCVWAFTGLVFAMVNIDYGSFPRKIKKVLEIMSNRAIFVYFLTIFLMLRYIGWNFQYYAIYLVPGLAYSICFIVYDHIILDFSKLSFKKIGDWIRVIAVAFLFGLASIPVQLLTEKYTFELFLFCLMWSCIGFLLSFIIQQFITGFLPNKIPSDLVNLISFLQFLIGICVGIGVNTILS